MPVTLPDRSNALIAMSLDGDAAAMAPVRASVVEALSRPYEVEITAVHGDDAPKAPADVLQKPVCLILRSGGTERQFNGVVREYVPLPAGIRGYQACTLKVVPYLWALSQATDCRVFQEKTTQEILEAVFEGAVDPEFRITGEDPPLPYRTQYNETNLRFVERIMEEAGWFYFFEQGDGAEKLVVTDANASLHDLGALPAEGALVGFLRPIHAVARGKEWTLDYNSETPTTEIKGEQETVLETTGALSPTSFVWPALTQDATGAAARSRLRMEAQEAAASLMHGEGKWAALSPGYVFEVIGGDTFLPEGKYAVRSIVHQAVDESWLTGGSAPSYGNSFEVFPEATTWRQPLATPRPRMAGLHAGIVIGGESDGDIFTDDMGRVKVKFFWDHRGDATPDQGVWARVVQPWAGKGWGGQFIPRVGTEVAVAFMDGDPDRPVVLGGLYNAADTAIFPAAEKTKSGFRTKSADQGGAEDFSEFSFDDKKGSELVFLHAQKDYKVQVENDLNLKVDNCRIVEIKADDTFTVKGKQAVTIKGDRAVTIEEGNLTYGVTKGNHETKVDTGNYAVAVTKGNFDTKVDAGNWVLDAGQGNVTVKAGAGSVTIEAAQSITLKVGPNTLEISSTGIAMKGAMLDLKGDTKADLASPATTVKGDGMLTLKGGIVMLN